MFKNVSMKLLTQVALCATTVLIGYMMYVYKYVYRVPDLFK